LRALFKREERAGRIKSSPLHQPDLSPSWTRPSENPNLGEA